MDRAAIGDQIDRILRSRSFAGKTQLMKLLEVLFDNMDSQCTLKPDRVIRGLWPDEIKTKRSADVATEMNRLRKALDCYYNEEGTSDPIVISLPNRSVQAHDGTKEKRWIVAEPREGTSGRKTRVASSAKARRSLMILAALAAIGIAAYVLVRVQAVDQLPQSARLDGATLIVMNAKGQELWRKTFPEGISRQFYENGLATRMWIGDLNGKGHSDILFIHQPMESTAYISSHSTTLICFSDRGREKWRWKPGRELPELEGDPATFVTVALAVLKGAPGRPSRIVASSHHVPWYPHQIAIIDADGKTLSEYWHSGHLDFITLADLGDGREEIIATGISNGYHAATLVVLDPDRVSGASSETARPEIQLHGLGVAHETIRLIFHRSDLNMAVAPFDEGQQATVENGKLRFSTLECSQNLGCRIWYEFDKDYHLLSVYADDYFRLAHNEFYRNGKDPHIFTKEEQAAFQQVRCLVGCKTEFVPVDIR